MIRVPLLMALLVAAAPIARAQEPRLTAADSIPLFDGKTLKGWVTTGGRYDGHAVWTVEDGAIVGRQGERGAGGLLYTARSHRNFIFSMETRIDHPFDSGVFVRMAPNGKGGQVTLDYRPGGEIGGIYSDGYLLHNKTAKASWIKNGWNRITVRCKGPRMHLTVWMNGRRITDYRLPEGAKGYAPTGLIGVQVHGGASTPPKQSARFRNIRVRQLPDYDARLFEVDDRGLLRTTERGRQAGWRPLFNGRDLQGWKISTASKDYLVRDGQLLLPRKGRPGNILTKEQFQDFQLRVDFRVSEMANSGLYLRAASEGSDPGTSGCEIQILDDLNWERVTKTKLRPWQFTGSLYGSVAPGVQGALEPADRWNSFEVTPRVLGRRYTLGVTKRYAH